MGTQNDSTTLPELDDDDQPEKLELHQISDRLDQRLCWARSVIQLILDSNEAERTLANAAESIDAHLREAVDAVCSLDRWRHDHAPTRARNLSDPNQREDEKRDIVRRLLQLKHEDTVEVTMCHIMIEQMEDRAEGLRLLDSYPLAYVHRFLSVQKDESERDREAN